MTSNENGRIPYKEAIRHNRRLKEAAEDEGISVGGTSKEANKLQAEILSVAEEMLTENSEWIDGKLRDLNGYLDGIDFEKIKESYFHGLKQLIKQHCRLLRKTNDPEFDTLHDEATLKEIVFAYTFDFVRSIRESYKQKLHPATSIEIAKKSFRLDPSTFRELSDEFPDFPNWIIVNAVTQHSHPRSFLTQVREKSDQFAEEFPYFDKWVVDRLVVRNFDDPNFALMRLQDRLRDLPAKYPDISSIDMLRICLNSPTDPEGFIKKVRKKIPELRRNFPTISDDLLTSAAIYHPKNSAAFLQNYLSQSPVLSAKYPDLPSWVINRALLSSPWEPTDLLDRVRSLTPTLQQKFGYMGVQSITIAIIGYKDPEEFLKWVDSQTQSLMERFPQANDGLISRAVVNSPSDPIGKLKHMVETGQISAANLETADPTVKEAS